MAEKQKKVLHMHTCRFGPEDVVCGGPFGLTTDFKYINIRYIYGVLLNFRYL